MPTIHQLESLLREDPEDVFLNFGLAMALAGAGKAEEALRSFDRTLELRPGYIPAYFQKGRVLAGLGRLAEARRALGAGIEAAAAAVDEHAGREMGEFLAALAKDNCN
jgi:tetratricopeptide (TPR) repeat protein